MAYTKLFLIVFSVLSISLNAQAQNFDQIVIKMLKEKQPIEQTGLAIAVVKDGRIIFAKGYGYRDRENKLPITTKTLFAIGSTTKAFTSLALKIAESRGQISFSEPVKTYLPEFSSINQKVTQEANLIDLLSHRTGLPRHDALWYISGYTRNELIPRLGCLPMRKNEPDGFRNSFVYNNLMVAAAGVALERVTNQTWEDFVSKNIFVPLSMNDSGFFAPDFSKNFAKPYFKNNLMPYKDYTNIGPAASVISHVEDMARWVMLHLAHGTNHAGASILTPAQMDSMYLPYNKENEILDYGLGWSLEKYRGTTLIQHLGSADGYTAYVSFLPSENMGVVVIANQHTNSISEDVAHAVYDAVVDPVFYQKPSDAEMKNFPPMEERELISPLPHTSHVTASLMIQKLPLSENTFNNCGYGDMKISGDGLTGKIRYGTNSWKTLQIPGLGLVFQIEAYGKKQFIPIIFSNGGKQFSLPLEPTSDDILFSR